jgi:mevalonate kinase
MKYPAKIILFGEHTVLRGSNALAVPLPTYGATWQFSESRAWQYRLPEFADWIEARQMSSALPSRIDTKTFKDELHQGLYLASDIPFGYGAGSSGVVCAAIVDRFSDGFWRNAPLPELQSYLAALEGFLHGASSGLDPLVSLKNHKIVVKPQSGAAPVHTLVPPMPEGWAIFLLDMGIPRDGAPFIKYVASQCVQPHIREQLEDTYIPAVNAAIDHYISGEWDDLFRRVRDISRFQWANWRGIIPDGLATVWEEGLTSPDFVLKTCGAGGGGFVLGFTNHRDALQSKIGEMEVMFF